MRICALTCAHPTHTTSQSLTASAAPLFRPSTRPVLNPTGSSSILRRVSGRGVCGVESVVVVVVGGMDSGRYDGEEAVVGSGARSLHS
eukprot:16382-Eustigmatos_ZCMA.PRE.1